MSSHGSTSMTWYRWLVLALVAALLAVAAWASFGLGRPLGMSTRAVDWRHEARSDGITVQCVAGDQAGTAALARWAAGYQAALALWLGVAPAPVSIRLFSDQAELRSWCTANLPTYTAAMNFCYVPGENAIYGCLGSDDWLRPRLQHELFHALARARLERLPLWLDEGLAELCEGLAHDGTRLRCVRIQGERLRHTGRLAARDQFDPASLDGIPPARFYGPEATRWYSAGYTTVLWLAAEGRLTERLRQGRGAIDRGAWRAFATDPAAWDAAPARLDAGFAAAGTVALNATAHAGR